MRTVKEVKVKDYILDGKKIYIQSMLNKRSDDIEGSVDQAVELEKAGCDIVRAAIPNMEAIKLIPAIKDCILDVDVENGMMKVHLLAGLR